MRFLKWGEFFWNQRNVRWGSPSYLLEPGDPGYEPPQPGDPDYVPPFPIRKKTKHTMKRQPYLPNNDPGVLALLVALDTSLPGALAAKYDVDAAQLLRLRHGRHAFGWFLDAMPIARQWSLSLTDAHDSMMDSEPAAPAALPGLPVLPPVPTFNDPPVTALLEPGFFDFVGRLVQQIKNHDKFNEPDGILLKIVGAEMPDPDPQIEPEVKWKLGPGGRPVISVKKTPFQGYQVSAAKGADPLVNAGFSTTRDYELDLPMPAPGQAEVWRVQVQYRYKGEPFGQKSQIIEIPVRG